MRFYFIAVPVVAALALASCGGSGPAASGEGTRTLASVSPHSSLTDEELDARILGRLLKLQKLNDAMKAANARGDFTAVNAKAKESLEIAGEAEALALHLDDPTLKARRLEGIRKISGGLGGLVEATGG